MLFRSGLLPIKKGHNGWPLLQKTKMPGVLIEPYFTTNNKAVKDRNIELIAKSVIDGYEEYLNC